MTMGLPSDKTVYDSIKYNGSDYFYKHTGLNENGLKVTTKEDLVTMISDIAHIHDSFTKVTIKAFPEH